MSRSPRSMFRPVFPYVYNAGRVKVSAWFGSKLLQAGLEEVKYQQLSVLGSTGFAIESGRWLTAVFARSTLTLTLYGTPDCSVLIPCHCQPPTTKSTALGAFPRNRRPLP